MLFVHMYILPRLNKVSYLIVSYLNSTQSIRKETNGGAPGYQTEYG